MIISLIIAPIIVGVSVEWFKHWLAQHDRHDKH
ncbi:type I toxin-antitoxin system Fst family toxin [Ligilactobacillus salitolerans]|nr:type I toxin-antitoxin system Fst family toxin [Ligilactobacillus salitolerans]